MIDCSPSHFFSIWGQVPSRILVRRKQNGLYTVYHHADVQTQHKYKVVTTVIKCFLYTARKY